MNDNGTKITIMTISTVAKAEMLSRHLPLPIEKQIPLYIGYTIIDAAIPKIIGVKKGKNIMIDATTAQSNNMKKKYEDIREVIKYILTYIFNFGNKCITYN
jgi:hypothetical protein